MRHASLTRAATLPAAALLTAGLGLAQTLPASWDRDVDWVAPPDSAHGTTQGNPAPDSEGNLVWHYEYVSTGGRLGSANPWYAEPATPQVWDMSWFGSEGAWAVADDFGPATRYYGLTHAGLWHDMKAIVRWKNVTAKTFEMHVLGSLVVSWSGDFNQTVPVDVDVVLARRDGGTGAITLLYAQTVPKPTNDTSKETVILPIDLGVLTVDPGDELLLSHLAYDRFVNSVWVTLVDHNLCLIESPIGTKYCGPAVENSSGYPGQIAASGSTKVADGDLTLKAFQLPPSVFGYFLMAPNSGFVSGPGGSDGNLCLSGKIGRLNRSGEIFQTGTHRVGSLALDLGDVPVPNGQVLPGETWYFQSWYRDGQTSNFTDALAVSFR